jgi:hypothetical protein
MENMMATRRSQRNVLSRPGTRRTRAVAQRDEEEIRSYGPGKFNDIIDGYVYAVTLDGGADREESYGEGGGWFGFVEINPSTRERIRELASEDRDRLTKAEEELLEDTAVVILFERSDGIVEADWYSSEAKAEKAWSRIEEEVGGEEEEEDDEGEYDEDDEVFSDEEMREGYVIHDARKGGYTVAHDGRHFGSYDDMDAALSDIKEHMERDNFYPNIYYVNERGNVDLLDSEGNIIRSRV